VAEAVVAVIGAGGFIGNRIVEVLHGERPGSVRPVVRRASSLALASRFVIDGRIAGTGNHGALVEALAGCDVVVNTIAGDPGTIVGTVQPVHDAARAAGCRRIVYLSSSAVHGQSPQQGTTEETPLPAGQGLPYNLAKVRAEARLASLAASSGMEYVILRPGIVYGPRSQWIGGLANDMLAGRAALVEGGSGLCNAIHVDNVVHAVRLACVTSRTGRAFLLGETVTPTWREFYARVAAAIGIPIESVPTEQFEPAQTTIRELVDELRRSSAVRSVLGALPLGLQRALGRAWAASGALPAAEEGPVVDIELALLHRARHVPSWNRARTELGYAPVVENEEGWRRTIAWLAFAGYPATR
jgi:nucleoside-diphosphate-sugar epimerase